MGTIGIGRRCIVIIIPGREGGDGCLIKFIVQHDVDGICCEVKIGLYVYIVFVIKGVVFEDRQPLGHELIRHCRCLCGVCATAAGIPINMAGGQLNTECVRGQPQQLAPCIPVVQGIEVIAHLVF